jgi:hypothetical protein
MIELEESDGHITDIHFGGERLEWNDLRWVLPKGLIGDVAVNDLPESERFEICASHEDNVIMLDTVLIRLQRVGNNRVRLEFNDSGTRQYWDGNVGFSLYMEAKKAIVEERAAQIQDLTFESYEDDGTWIHLTYTTEIEGTAEMRLGTQLWAPSDAQSEKEFTLGTVLPIIRKLGFQNVRYNHGKREFGRDVLFARITEFQELEFWGAQVKFGDVSGAAVADVNELLCQLDDAFKMPFYDLYTKQQQRISKLAIIVSGKFTENAIEKICEKIESHALRNNVVFVDGEKLSTLAERFRGR